MTANLVKLTSCRNAIEAETIRNRLQTAGIRAVVQGAEVGTALSYVGVAIGYPNIEVDANDLTRAHELLAADRVALHTVGAWNCSRCGEFNEPAFEVCWSCNKTRADEDPRASFEPGDSESEESLDEIVSPFADVPTIRPIRDASNPYQSPAFARDDDSSRSLGDDQALHRAFTAAIFGGVMPIMIFTIYSLSILIPLAIRRAPVIHAHPMKFYGALGINLLVSVIFFAVLFG
jgi:hypothetical protein